MDILSASSLKNDGDRRADVITRTDELHSGATQLCRYLALWKPYVCTSCQIHHGHLDDILKTKLWVAGLETPIVFWIAGLENIIVDSYFRLLRWRRCTMCKIWRSLLLADMQRGRKFSRPPTKDWRDGVWFDVYTLRDALALWTDKVFERSQPNTAADFILEKYATALSISVENPSPKSKLDYRPVVHLPVDERRPKGEEYSRAGPFDPRKANMSVIKKWITKCLHDHPQCNLDLRSSLELQVIDCLTAKVVEKPRNTPYLTLSYVWGSRKTIAEWPSHNLAEGPRVVRDAMHVTKKLGYRYLWVDKYCIDQSNELIKMIQIGMMDKIYESSTATLVAAHGTNESVGLAGAGTWPYTPRKRPHCVRLGRHTTALMTPSIMDVLTKCKWATRGWTLQEAVLSRRCIFFTDTRVWFACWTATYCESLARVPRIDEDLNTQCTIKTLFESMEPKIKRRYVNYCTDYQGRATSLNRLTHWINTYTARVLSYDSDALNAFRGILSRSSLFSFWGVPLMPREGRELGQNVSDCDDEEARAHSAFMRGLAWTALDGFSAKRRVGMPTWSWVSLAGSPISFAQDPEKTCETHDQFPATWCDSTKIWCQGITKCNTSGWVPIGEQWKSRNGNILPEIGSQLKLEALVGTISNAEIVHEDSDSFAAPPRSEVKVKLYVQGQESLDPPWIPAMLDSVEDLAIPYKSGHDVALRCENWKIAFLAYQMDLIKPDSDMAKRSLYGYGPNHFYLLLTPEGSTCKRIGSVPLDDELRRHNGPIPSFQEPLGFTREILVLS